MGKKKNTLKDNGNQQADEKIVKIYEEAYYRAMKRIEKENSKTIETKERVEIKSTRMERLGFFLNAALFPIKISKRFSVDDSIYESIIVLFISQILKGLGLIMWLIGILVVIYSFLQISQVASWYIWIMALIIGATSWLLGSIFIIVSSKFEREEDSNKIYTFSGSILALL